MHVIGFTSYADSFSRIQLQHKHELTEIISSIEALNSEEMFLMPGLGGTNPHPIQLERLWEKKIAELGWGKSFQQIGSFGNRGMTLRSMGFIKGRIATTFIRHKDQFNRWLYNTSPLAVKNGMVDIPVAILPSLATEEFFSPRVLIRNSHFESINEDLVALSPLSHGHPFLLIGISQFGTTPDVLEIETESETWGSQVVLDRSIEFPSEFHQAGLGILSYFGNVLREKYPNHDSKVRIEQDGMNVRLVVESKNGDREIIEKALHDYEMVVRGEAQPETLFVSPTKVIELKNELRIAKVRIESQTELLAYQGGEIATLRQLIGHALTTPKDRHINIEVNPVINITNTTSSSLYQNLAPIADSLHELASASSFDPDIQIRILDLIDSVNAIQQKDSAESVRTSSGLRKLKKFVDEATEIGSSVSEVLEKVGQAGAFVQKIGRYYNNIAEWCGAPVIPRALLGGD